MNILDKTALDARFRAIKMSGLINVTALT